MWSSPLLHVTLELDHALRALLVLAGEDGAPRTAADLSAATDVPGHFLAKVLQKLHRAGVLRRLPRVRGFLLARPASAITLAEVVAAIQGCWSGAPDVPGARGADALDPLWRDVEGALEAQLSELTLADLVGREPQAVGSGGRDASW
jgi:Rrf2 family protein